MTQRQTVELDEDHGLGVVRTMPEFRQRIAQGPLTEDQSRTLVDQAEILIEGLYVHLPLKRAMHAVDPVQSLRLLRHRLPELTELEFHAGMQRIFIGLRDLHTNYILPSRFHGFAFLGILIERCVNGGETKWIVTKTFDHLTGDPNLVVGAEVTHWNGTPMAIAVAANASREAGSNKAASLSRGLENMTMRPVSMSLPPDEDWVELTYRVADVQHETRLPWRVFDSTTEVTSGEASASLPTGVNAAAAHLVGLDLRTELTRQIKRRLFAPGSLGGAGPTDGSAAPAATAEELAAGVVPTTRPELKARVVDTQHGSFGHLRIFTFAMQDQNINAFLNEVLRLLSLLPPDGLILDVRGNGGGYVVAAEFLLQFFSPLRIQPEPMQFICNKVTAEMCHQVDDYEAWRESIDESITTGAPFSSAIPLYPADVVNSVGQVYQGPVVLVTDAQCYSATDIFSAGFQDHAIGPVLGVDTNTGAGGANVLTHNELAEDWTDGPLRVLPKGSQFRVALRRCLRVGARAGQPVEDLGVVPDHLHDITVRDLLEDNADLMETAGGLLAEMTPRRLVASAAPAPSGDLTLTIETTAITSVDVYVDGRPVDTTATPDGTTHLDIPPQPPDSVIRLEGFDDKKFVASHMLSV